MVTLPSTDELTNSQQQISYQNCGNTQLFGKLKPLQAAFILCHTVGDWATQVMVPMTIVGEHLAIILSQKVGRGTGLQSQYPPGPARCSVLVWPHRLCSVGPAADGYIHRVTSASSHILLNTLTVAEQLAHLNAWLPLPHLFKLQDADFIKLCLHLHQHGLVTAKLDRLFKVTGAKRSCNKLLWAINANSKVSLKLD